MSVTYAGSFTLGELLPLPLLSQTRLAATAALSLTDAQARLSAALAASVAPPPALGELIASLQQMIRSLQDLLANPLPAVSISAVADLQALVGDLQASANFAIELGQIFASPGVHYVLFAGKDSEVSGAIGSTLAGLPGVAAESTVAGVVLLASDGGTIAALRKLFR